MASLQYLLERRQHLIADSSLSARLYSYRQLITTSRIDELLPTEHLTELQQDYFAGAVSIVLTNTFDANRVKLGLLGMASETMLINERAARLTREATRGYERHVAVAGNIGPVGRPIAHADAVNCYAEQAEALARGAVDCFWLESFASRESAEAAITGCEIGAPHIPIIVTLSFLDGDRLPVGILPISATHALCSRPGVLAVGVDTGAGSLDLVQTSKQIGCNCRDTALVIKMDLDTISAESTNLDISINKSIDSYTAITKAAMDAGARIIAAGRDAMPVHLQAMSAVLTNQPLPHSKPYNSSKISRKI